MRSFYELSLYRTVSQQEYSKEELLRIIAADRMPNAIFRTLHKKKIVVALAKFGKEVVPDLIRVINSDSDSQYDPDRCLELIGAEAFPDIASVILSSDNNKLRGRLFSIIRFVNNENALNQTRELRLQLYKRKVTDKWIVARRASLAALLMFDSVPAEVLAEIKKCLTDEDNDVKELAKEATMKFIKN